MTRTMKKFTGFVLMVCMIVSLFAGVTTAFAAKDFKDVPGDNWAKPYVDFVVDKGYFAGATADLFKPDDNMTRGMFVAVIAKVEGLTLDNNVAVDFNDVQSGKYYAGAVKWATDNGIVSGYGNGSFGPNDAITREQICVMMDKYIQYHDANNDTKYLDRKASVDFKDASDISSWAKDSVQKCVSYGLVQGFPDGKFYPKRNATRAEVAVMIYRLALWKEVVDGDEYKVSYKYESGTEGVALPEALNILIVPDSRTFHTGDIAEAYDPALTSFFADGKLWKFEGYKEKTVTVKDADVEFVGVWVVESETQKAYSVKYVYADIDGKTAVPVEAPKDEKTYKKGDKVTASAPESPVKTDKGTWTFVGWDKDGAKTKTETVEDHDIVFTGYWKYSATKFHVTYVAKMYGTGEDLPKEVAKELEGRCPVDNNEYNDGAWVWIKQPTSKADYNDDTGRVWNYRGATYNIATTIKGADIEVVEYWGYAGVPYIVTYSNEYEEDMSWADKRNVDNALPQPKIESHRAGETVSVRWPTATSVAKGENLLPFIVDYDVDSKWVFDYYEYVVDGVSEIYKPDNDQDEFRMPSTAVGLIAHWKLQTLADVYYENNPSGVEELDSKLPKSPTKDKVVAGDTLKVQHPSTKTIKSKDGETYTYIGASIGQPISDKNSKKLINDSSYVLKDGDVNGDSVTVYWNWVPQQITVTYTFKPSNVPEGLKDERLVKESEPYPMDTKEVSPSWNIRGKYQVYEEAGQVWVWQGWDALKKPTNGKDVEFVGTWSRSSSPVAVYEFVNINKADGLDQAIINNEPDPENHARNVEFPLPGVGSYDAKRWKFLGWATDKAGKNMIDGTTTKLTRNGVTTIYGIWEYIGDSEIG